MTVVNYSRWDLFDPNQPGKIDTRREGDQNQVLHTKRLNLVLWLQPTNHDTNGMPWYL